MKVHRAGWTAFRVPFKRPFVTAHGTTRVREGVLVKLTADDGRSGWGEASAVPGFGGDPASVMDRISAAARGITGLELDEADRLVEAMDLHDPNGAASACAFDTALADLRAQAEGVPLTRLLGGDPEWPVPVNATVSATTVREAVRAAEAAVRAGFRCVKLKVGAAGSVAAEVARVRAVREALGPGLGLRIDANGAWDVATAVRVLRGVEGCEVDFVEQPVPAEDLAGMARVRWSVGVPVAADEAVGCPDQARRVIASKAADVLVVKPMLAGGPRRAVEVVALARDAGLRAVVTTTIDTGIGVAMALHVAASLPHPPPPCGLATASLLVSDLLADTLAVEAGAMRVPGGAGLGVTLEPSRLARFTDAWNDRASRL